MIRVQRNHVLDTEAFPRGTSSAHMFDKCWSKPRPRGPCCEPSPHRHRPGDAIRHEPHREHEERPEHRIDEVARHHAGDVGPELEEQSSGHDAPHRCHAAEHRAHQKEDREPVGEALGCDEIEKERGERAGDGRVRRPHPKVRAV